MTGLVFRFGLGDELGFLNWLRTQAATRATNEPKTKPPEVGIPTLLPTTTKQNKTKPMQEKRSNPVLNLVGLEHIIEVVICTHQGP